MRPLDGPTAPPGAQEARWGRGVLLVVDGAVDLPDRVTRSPGCRMAAGEIWLDGARVGGGGAQLWSLLRSDRYPSTSPPSVSALLAAYGRGGPAVGVHVSGRLSVTVARAHEAVARRDASPGSSAHVIDTGSLSVGAGLVALAVHEATEHAAEVHGAEVHGAEVLAAVARSVSDRLHTFALVQDVRALRHSERASLVPRAHLTSHHPLVLAVRGRVVPLAQPRHRRLAVDELARHVQGTAGGRLGAWALGHGDARDLDAAVSCLTDRLGAPPRYTVELGPTVGTHLGPDSLVVGAVIGEIGAEAPAPR